MSILDFWPVDYPMRDGQKEVLLWIEQQRDKKYLICEAPVGSGKSLIGLTASRFLEGDLGDSFVLTPQRILQRQYEDEFVDNEKLHLRSLYGKTNYTCESKNTNCEIGGSIGNPCANCPHKSAKSEANASANVVMNYQLALLYFAHSKNPEDFPRRKLMVCDECHGLEGTLTEFDAVDITREHIRKVGVKWTPLSDILEAHKWVCDVYQPALSNYLEDLQNVIEPIMEDDHHTPDELQQIREYFKFEEHNRDVSELRFISKDALQTSYVLVHDKMNLKFKRINASTSFHRHLKNKASQFLFMSATILDHEGFCKDMGIPLEEAAFYQLDSAFPAENRQVVYMPQMKMNRGWNGHERKAERDEYINVINQICTMHEGQSGIIHTASFQIAEWLCDNLDIPQRIYQHNPDSELDRNYVIDSFQDDMNPSILISPSCTEGLDLKEDRARFGIIAKVGYPFLGDQWIACRKDMSQEWYNRQTIISIIQGCGRIVRSETDTGINYILDGSFGYLYQQMHSQIPKWWKEAYTTL